MKKINSLLIILSAAMLLTGCVNENKGGMKKAKLNAETVAGFTILTNLEEEKTIHTAQQATYLAYDGEYVSIPEDDYPNGQKHLSDPEPVNIAWDYNAPTGKAVASFDVQVGKEADLSDGYVVSQGLTTGNVNVYNSYLGDNYFRIMVNFTDGTHDRSDIYKYVVEDIYPRNLKIGGMTNCRDMGGGRVLENGGRIKQGMIFRTSGTHSWGGTGADNAGSITEAGKEELLTRLGCKTEINVNNSGSNQVGVQNFVGAYMWYDGGKHHLYRNAEPLKEVFRTLANPDNYPLFYHCRIGTDRTGLCAIMISGLLGVSENEIFQDYLFSNFGHIQEKRYIGEKAGRDNILNYINDLRAFPGEKFQNKVYNYLLSIGVSAEDLNSVIDILTEGNKAEGNDNCQAAIFGEDLVGNGIEPIHHTGTHNAHPDVYYTLATDTSVSASFDAKFTGQAKLVAYLGNSDSSSSKKIVDSIYATVDGNEVYIDENLTFADAGFGSGASRTYYSAVVLGDVDIYEGATDVEVFGLANNLNIGGISIIPNERIIIDNGDEPAPEPGAKKGCGGSIVMTASLLSLIAVGGVAFIFVKRKED